MKLATVVDAIGSVAALGAAGGGLVVNATLDKLGRVDELSQTVRTPVNASGLQR